MKKLQIESILNRDTKDIIYKDILPNKLHEIAQMAYDDMILIEKSKNFSINMNCWLEIDKEHKTCEVCLAGAVMINRLNISPFYNTLNFSETLEKKLDWLDWLRDGILIFDKLSFIQELSEKKKKELKDYKYYKGYTSYWYSSKKFKAWLRDVIKFLKSHDV